MNKAPYPTDDRVQIICISLQHHRRNKTHRQTQKRFNSHKALNIQLNSLPEQFPED